MDSTRKEESELYQQPYSALITFQQTNQCYYVVFVGTNGSHPGKKSAMMAVGLVLDSGVAAKLNKATPRGKR